MPANATGKMTRRAALASVAMIASVSFAQAQTPAEFYKGKQMQMMVYSGAGSTYDTYARLLSRHMVRHIPGSPNIVVQNMVGAGGLKLVDYLNRIAPRDGTVFGTVSRGNPFDPIMGKKDIEFDPLKFTWIGSMNRETAVALSWGTSPVKTFEDVRKIELLVPGTGAGADSEIIPRAYNNLAGTKFKIVSGYRDTSEASLQLETGELQGIAYWSMSAIMSLKPDWVQNKKINILFHTGVSEAPDLPGVPRIRELVKDETDRKALEFLLAREVMGRPFVGPPGIPADRAKALRDAFDATMKDPEFLKDAARGNVEVNLVTAEEINTLLRDAAALPPAVIERARQVLERN
jgi:tripartite-type tricarboxylate transporter receptor subunit TctC